MNKKALAIGIEAKVCEWIYTQLEEKARSNREFEDLLEGLKGLKDKEYGCLILNRKESEEMTLVESEQIRSGKLAIDMVNRSVYYDNKVIQLTPKEFDILYLLANNKGKVYTKEQIYNGVWKDNYTYDDNNIMAHIRKLRKKIEPNPAKPIFIITMWGVGYKFGGE